MLARTEDSRYCHCYKDYFQQVRVSRSMMLTFAVPEKNGNWLELQMEIGRIQTWRFVALGSNQPFSKR